MQAIFVTNPEDDADVIRHKAGAPVEGTTSWLFRNPAYTIWMNTDADILWLHGNPGKGKTMLALAAVQELEEKIELEGPTSKSVLGYFLCDSKDDRRNTPVSILRGLIHQLLCHHREHCGPLKTEYERQKDQLFNSANAMSSLWRVFCGILEYPNFHSAYLVVDALDECAPDDVEAFLAMVALQDEVSSKLSKQRSKSFSGRTCKVKWLLTSRNEEHIKNALLDRADISLEQNLPHVLSDVRRFNDHKIERLARIKRYPDDLKAAVYRVLLDRSEGTFLWVALVCRELARPRVSRLNTEEVLGKMPTGLAALYDRMFEQLKDEATGLLEDATIRMMQAMVVAFRPLTLPELGIAANLSSAHRGDDTLLAEYVSTCGSFIEMRRNAVHFTHLSARDYLVTSGRLFSDIVSDLQHTHQMIAENTFRHVCE